MKIKITIPPCHPRQIHVRHRMQETLTEPCELVISQMQALSWTTAIKTRLCVVSKLHPHVGDTTNPSTKETPPARAAWRRLEGRRASISTCEKNMRNSERSPLMFIHPLGGRRIRQCAICSDLSAVQSAQLPLHVRAQISRNRRMW